MTTNVSRHGTVRAEPTGWVGWFLFAGITAIVLGAFQVIEGLVAVFRDSYYVAGANNLLVHVNYDAWGWTHFGIGAAILIAGFGVLAGTMWGRVLGITVAVISAVVNLAFIAAYPLWGVIIIALDVVMIYALAVHGREMKTMRES
ncbi:MAG: hypothetical protein ACM3ML_01240 [Micromonosporaceae bacterium]